jgi:anti-sigma factor ChrR (cupin superfamily)
MDAETPNCLAHAGLDDMASRYVTVADLEWTPAGCPGMNWKILFQDKARGLLTALVRFDPGAVLDLHRHVDIEQTYVLEGTLEDDEGICGPGDFVWRPKGNCHRAVAPNGALLLAIFQTPNVFLEGPMAGRSLE